MNNPFDYTPDAACEEAFRDLLLKIEDLQESHCPEVREFCRELKEGKMLGVLIAEDKAGGRHTLYAYSGQSGKTGFHFPGFVEPVFDYLVPEGYFKRKEAEISRMNHEIDLFEKESLVRVMAEYESVRERCGKEIAAFKEKITHSKRERAARRESGLTDADERGAMVRQSQFEKAELSRMKKRSRAVLAPVENALEAVRMKLGEMKEKRRNESEALQAWLFSNFKVSDSRGEMRSLSEIFAATSMGVPPSGAGECCAPKLLQAAYRRGWTPVSIAEYWYGNPKRGEVRRHGVHYPACRGKCLPVLRWMLGGLSLYPPLEEEMQSGLMTLSPEIIYENEWFCVIDKPSGMLSVPGKGKTLSVQTWLEERYGAERGVKVAHRLDQDTSGLLVATFGSEAFRLMQSLFATRRVSKTYEAELEDDYKSRGLPQRGIVSLPLSPDWLDRPRQRVDFEDGKEAVTEYEFAGVTDGRSKVIFHPLTGRTHQLRVHAASDAGLGLPIVGDRLYGSPEWRTAPRLALHARHIEFTFPLDGRRYSFEIPPVF